VQVLDLHVQTVADIERAYATAAEWGADGLFLLPDPALAGAVFRRVAEVAAKTRLPPMYADRVIVADFGGLMSWHPACRRSRYGRQARVPARGDAWTRSH
jgi:hypothetical protein